MKLTKKDAMAILKQAIKDNKDENLHLNEEGNPKQDWDFEIVNWLSANPSIDQPNANLLTQKKGTTQ